MLRKNEYFFKSWQEGVRIVVPEDLSALDNIVVSVKAVNYIYLVFGNIIRLLVPPKHATI